VKTEDRYNLFCGPDDLDDGSPSKIRERGKKEGTRQWVMGDNMPAGCKCRTEMHSPQRRRDRRGLELYISAERAEIYKLPAFSMIVMRKHRLNVNGIRS
jgi:hypothetical protein